MDKMNKLLKMKKLFLYATISIISSIGFFIISCYAIFYLLCYLDIVDNPKDILSTYQLGEMKENIKNRNPHYYKELKGPLDRKQLSFPGYNKPKRPLYKNESLLIYYDGEYFLYLYFDNNGRLFHKEIKGS